MSKTNPKDNNQGDYLKFPEKLIAEVRHAINEEFKVSAISWVKFTFGQQQTSFPKTKTWERTH